MISSLRKALARAAALFIALSGHPVLAGTEQGTVGAAEEEESIVFAAVEELRVVEAEPLGRVYLATPVGRVSFGPEAAGEGLTRYAVRSKVAGSASLISFSSTLTGNITSGSVVEGHMPLARGRLTSRFGVPRPGAGGTRWHAGVDLAAPIGSPVLAAYPGRVALADWNGGYGLLVVVDHGGGVQTRYAHLSRLGVLAGQRVVQGEVLGFVGSTGNSTGPHLHYELRRNGRPIDPLRR